MIFICFKCKKLVVDKDVIMRTGMVGNPTAYCEKCYADGI